MNEDLVARVTGVIAKSQHIPPESVTIDSTFEELKIDSLDGINILFALEGEFDVDIPDDEAKQIRSVRQAAEGIEKLLASKRRCSMTRRVAVTGIGVISALGRARDQFWQALASGESGIRPMTLVPPVPFDFPTPLKSPIFVPKIIWTRNKPTFSTASRSSP